MTNTTIDPISYKAGIEAAARAIADELVELCEAGARKAKHTGDTFVLERQKLSTFIRATLTQHLHHTEPQTAPASCPNCADETDCSNVRQCRAVEEAYAAPADAARLALAERIAGPLEQRVTLGGQKFDAFRIIVTTAERDLIVSSLRAGGWREDMQS